MAKRLECLELAMNYLQRDKAYRLLREYSIATKDDVVWNDDARWQADILLEKLEEILEKE